MVRPPAVTSSGPRVEFLVSTFAGECDENAANAHSKNGLPRRRDRPAVEELVRLLLGDRVPEAVAELLSRQRDRPCSLFYGLLSTTEATLSAEGGSARTPLIGAGSIATAAAASPWARRRWTMSPPNEWPIASGFVSSPPIAWA